MKLVKLSATDSTNEFLKNLIKDSFVENWTAIVTEEQTKGKGQLKNKWQSESGKNLTFSTLCKFDNLKIQHSFYLNCITSLAVFNTLNKYIPNKLKVKWPNDIMSASKKVCGILIENTVSNDAVTRSIIGIGLNVNQEDFEGLPNASSLKILTGEHYDKFKLLEEIINELKNLIILIEEQSFKKIKNSYEKELYRFQQPAMYKDNIGNQFMGKILGINDQGQLLVALENETVRPFGLKEIQFI